MANIHTTDWKNKELPVSGHDGADYDACPNCGTPDVEPAHKAGGMDGRREETHLWSMYCHDRRKGGCGHTWTRTDRRRAEVERARGINPLHLTASGQANRTVFMPTDAYRDNYDRIFRKAELSA